MNSMLKIISTILVVLTLLSGCTSQSSQTNGQNFDQLKAAKTRVSLGLTYLKNGNFSQAKFNLDKALEFAPRSADANFAMAYYYQSVSELEQAEKAYQFAMDLEPNNANIANSYGAFLCENGDYQKAKTYFLKAVNTSSYVSSAETYENLAMCSYNQGRPEDSIQYLRNAVNHQPGRASSLYLLAQTLVETQQWQEAREILRKYEKVSQISPQSLLLAMKIESGTGNDATAKGYLDMLLRIFPNDPITRSAYAEHKRSSESQKNRNNLSVLGNKNKDVPVLVETQAPQSPEDNAIVVVENTQPTANVNESKIVQQEMPKETEAKPDFQQQSNELVKKTENSVVLNEEPKVSVELVESELPADKAVIEEGVNETVVDDLEANNVPEEMPQDNVTVEEQLPVQDSEVAPEVLEKPRFHVVAKGDNLYRISLLYNIKMQRLIDWNGLADKPAIYVGMKLSLVAPSVVE